jgi:hypothetical protein
LTSRRRISGLLLVTVANAVACTFPRPDAKLPEAPYIAVLSGQMPAPIDQVARHSWIVVQPSRKPLHRYEYGRVGSGAFEDFAAGDVMIHGIVAGTPSEIDALDACLAKASSAFYKNFTGYFPIPGPNSNTFVAYLDRRCGLGVELPATAIGRDYVGPVGASVTEGGTGIEVGSIPLGIRMGIREGLGVQIFGLPIGVHLDPPGIDVPVNPGRIGFATDEHTYRKPTRTHGDSFPEEASATGAGSAELYASGFAVVDPKRAAGLEGIGLAGVSVRFVYGHYVGYVAGLDLEMGASTPAGLAGGAHLYPIGVGAMVSPTGFVAVLGGIGASGVTGLLPSGLEVPLEERLELDLGPRARVSLFARQTFTALEPLRELGLFGSGEAAFGIRARLGDARGIYDGAYGSGYFFGFEHRELAGTSMIGALFGTEIDAGFNPRERRHVVLE